MTFINGEMNWYANICIECPRIQTQIYKSQPVMANFSQLRPIEAYCSKL